MKQEHFPSMNYWLMLFIVSIGATTAANYAYDVWWFPQQLSNVELLVMNETDANLVVEIDSSYNSAVAGRILDAFEFKKYGVRKIIFKNESCADEFERNEWCIVGQHDSEGIIRILQDEDPDVFLTACHEIRHAYELQKYGAPVMSEFHHGDLFTEHGDVYSQRPGDSDGKKHFYEDAHNITNGWSVFDCYQKEVLERWTKEQISAESLPVAQ